MYNSKNHIVDLSDYYASPSRWINNEGTIKLKSVNIETLKSLAIEAGCPEDIANHMVNDTPYHPSEHDGWKFLWPTWESMKQKYPKYYEEWEDEIEVW